jgi:hypothetical protein
MLEQNPTKVKRKIKSVINSISSELSVPDYKFVLEMVSASISSGSLNLMELSRSLKEGIGIKHTHKRLQRHVSNGGIFLNLSNKYCLTRPAEPIGKDTFIYLDGGDLSYSKATSYEHMSTVMDGSTGKLKQGYPLNMIACCNGSGRVFPLYLDIFHRHVGYTSDNTETYKAIDCFMSRYGSNGIWTMDRGYDSYRIMEYILERGGMFNIRLKGNRHLQCVKHKSLASEIAAGLNRRYKLGHGSYGYKHCYLREHAVTLVYYKDRNADLILLNSGHISKTKIISQRIQGYFKRWGVEECYKFIKQSFGLEKARVSSFSGIRCLLGVVMLAWQVLIEVSKDNELEYIVLNASKMCISKKVVFDYYRIIKGIMMIFNSCKEMYRYRKRRQKQKHNTFTIEDFLPKYDRFAACY